MPFSNYCNDPADRLSSVDMEWEQWEEELIEEERKRLGLELFTLPEGVSFHEAIFEGEADRFEIELAQFHVSYREVVA